MKTEQEQINTERHAETPESPVYVLHVRNEALSPDAKEALFLHFCEVLRTDPGETIERAFEACAIQGIELTEERINWLIICLEASKNE